MELFTIQCTTCRARLKVKDESAIGDILACPKCGSMVQVVPPSDWSGSAATAAPIVAPAPAPKSAKAATVVPPALPVMPKPATASIAAAKTVSASSVPPQLPAPATQAAEGAAIEPALRSSFGHAVLASIRQDWKLYCTGLAAGVIAGAALWIALGPDHSAAPATNAGPPVQLAQAPTPSSQQAPSGVDGALATRAAQNARQDDAAPTIEATSGAGDVAPAEEQAPARGEVPTTEQSDAAPAAADATDVAEEGRTIKLEPVTPSAKAPSGENGDAPHVAPSAADEPAVLAQAVDAPKQEQAGSEIAASALSASEVDDRLSASLAKAQFVKMPLAQFVSFVANLTNLPIVIDEQSLAKAHKRRDMPVTIRLEDATAREALDAATESLGLAWSIRGGKLVIAAGEDRAPENK